MIMYFLVYSNNYNYCQELFDVLVKFFNQIFNINIEKASKLIMSESFEEDIKYSDIIKLIETKNTDIDLDLDKYYTFDELLKALEGK